MEYYQVTSLSHICLTVSNTPLGVVAGGAVGRAYISL